MPDFYQFLWFGARMEAKDRAILAPAKVPEEFPSEEVYRNWEDEAAIKIFNSVTRHKQEWRNPLTHLLLLMSIDHMMEHVAFAIAAEIAPELPGAAIDTPRILEIIKERYLNGEIEGVLAEKIADHLAELNRT
jgi:hypothetical protein